jgi:catechol 2,3-dioxygenase-like lactoylglutathione lyase family enzyme
MRHTPKPTPEDALVLYYPDTEAYRRVTERLAAAGIEVVNTENPYWHGISTCYSDPDGYLLIIANIKGIG